MVVSPEEIMNRNKSKEVLAKSLERAIDAGLSNSGQCTKEDGYLELKRAELYTYLEQLGVLGVEEILQQYRDVGWEVELREDSDKEKYLKFISKHPR